MSGVKIWEIVGSEIRKDGVYVARLHLNDGKYRWWSNKGQGGPFLSHAAVLSSVKYAFKHHREDFEI